MDYKRAILNFSYVVPNVLAGMAKPGQVAALAEDLAFLKYEGIRAILSLSEVSLQEDLVHQNEFAYLHVPVNDFRAPTMDQVEQCVKFLKRMIAEERRPVVVHCGAGCGRTGTILACYFVKTGMTAEDAIEHIRSMRPCSIETDGQKAAVYQYEEHLKYKSFDSED